MSKDNKNKSDVQSEKKLGARPSKQQSHTSNEGENARAIDSVQSTVNTVAKAIDDFNKIARGVASAVNLVKLVTSFADPDAYNPGDIPGGTTNIEELVPDEYQDASLAHNILTKVTDGRASNSSGYRVLAIDYAITNGDSAAYDQIIDKMYQDLERAANYTNPFSRSELARYVEECKHSMLLMCKLLMASAISNTMPIGDSYYPDCLYGSLFGDGTSSPSLHSLLKTDLYANRPALIKEVAAFADFIHEKVIYDAPIMSEIFAKNTVVFADSKQSQPCVIIFNGHHNCDDCTNLAPDIVHNTLSIGGRFPSMSVANLIAAARDFRASWSQTNSRIGAKMLRTKAASSIIIPYEKWLNNGVAEVYHPEINAQLRNALFLDGIHYATNGTALDSGINVSPIGRTNPYGQVEMPALSQSTFPMTPDRHASLYTRIGKGNHLTSYLVEDVPENGHKDVPYVGIVSTEDYPLTDARRVASALALVPRLMVTKATADSSGFSIVFAGVSPEIVIGGRFIIVDVNSGLQIEHPIAEKYDAYGTGMDIADFIYALASRSSTFSAATNWLNAPIFDCIVHYNNSGTTEELRDTTAVRGMLLTNTMYEKIYQVSADELRSNKRTATYSLHRTPAIRKGLPGLRE